jgi:hypothetical protein
MNETSLAADDGWAGTGCLNGVIGRGRGARRAGGCDDVPLCEDDRDPHHRRNGAQRASVVCRLSPKHCVHNTLPYNFCTDAAVTRDVKPRRRYRVSASDSTPDKVIGN